MNFISKLMGVAIMALSVAMIVLGLAFEAYARFSAPRHPDPASGHIIPVMLGYSNMALNHFVYMTRFEHAVLGVSGLFVGFGFIGVFGYVFATGKLKKPTSFG